jgi:hypothetical protein
MVSGSRLAQLLLLAVASTAMAQDGGSVPSALAGPAQATSDETVRSPWQPSRAFVQVGGGEGTNSQTAGLQWPWPSEPVAFAGSSLHGYVELAIGHWESHHDQRGGATSTLIGIAPALRYDLPRHPRWFADAALGINAITPIFHDRFNDFSTVFNFSEHIGIGYRPEGGRWEWALRVQHFSNGGIHKPNPGQNFLQFRVSRQL